MARLLLLLQCSIAVACGGGSGEQCNTDGDCASGFCKADGTCGPAPLDAATGVDGTTTTDGMSSLCTANHDGQIQLAELPLAAGKMATFRISESATWDTAGASNNDGSRRWDLSGALTGDGDHAVALASPQGAWWASKFPSATYATPLAQSSNLLGVFEVSATGLTLLGVVSPAAGASRTELTYDPPAKVLALPFGAGSTWMSTSTVSGLAQGIGGAYTEKYASRVDQVGTMKTPYGDFPVVRVATDLTRTSGLATILTKRSYTWVAECFGPVAVAHSQDFESSVEFNDPAEVRRLAP